MDCREVRVPCSLISPTLYPQLLPLSQQTRKETLFLISRLGFSDLVSTPGQRFCPQWNLDLKAFPASQVAEDGMNCSASREELSSLCATSLLHALTLAQPRKMGVGNGGAEGRNSKAKEMV